MNRQRERVSKTKRHRKRLNRMDRQRERVSKTERHRKKLNRMDRQRERVSRHNWIKAETNQQTHKETCRRTLSPTQQAATTESLMRTLCGCVHFDGATPRTASLGRVGSDLEKVTAAWVESFDGHRDVRRVRHPVVDVVQSFVVDDLIEDDVSVAMPLRRGSPHQTDARCHDDAVRGVHWRTGRN